MASIRNPEIYGVPMEYILLIRDVVDHRLLRDYRSQRTRAVKRGIVWELNLKEWYEIWQRSGKLEERGRHDGDHYVMGRKGDIGPYSADNVYICTVRQNARDARRNKPYGNSPNKDAIRGYYYMPYACPTKPYWVRARGKFVGYFATAEEARAAYLIATE